MNHRFARCCAALLSLAIAACAPLGGGSASGAGAALRVAAGEEGSTPLPPALRLARGGSAGIDFLLLGEVHDNPAQHALRLHWLKELARAGPFVLAMEQLDADRQDDVDRALAAGLPAREIARAGGFAFDAWGWTLYGPFFEFAAANRIRVVAANLSRAQAGAIARRQPHAMSDVRPSDWGQADAAALADEIRQGHCGMLPERAVEPLAAAQRARDATMARAVALAREEHSLPVVLLAGNGHVSRERGVPRYLHDVAPGDRVFSVGLLEAPVARSREAAFDLVVETAAHERADPCEGLKAHFSKTPPGR